MTGKERRAQEDPRVDEKTNPIHLVDAPGGLFAAVRGHVALADIPDRIMPMVDAVWACIRAAEYKDHGHNVWLYRNHADGEADVEIGVEVAARFETSGDVAIAELPAGAAAHTWHYGDYGFLPQVHEALLRWCAEQQRPIASVCWEVYGDWHDNPALRRTDVYRLLAV